MEGCIIVVLHLDRAAAQAEHQHFVLDARVRVVLRFGGAVSRTLRFGAMDKLCCCCGVATSCFLSAVSNFTLPPLQVVDFFGMTLCEQCVKNM